MSEYEKLHARIAQLVERNDRLGAALECAYGDLAQAKQIIDRNQKDADRYRWLRDNDQLDPRYQHDALTIAFADLTGGALDGIVDSIISQKDGAR